mgnify:CR=1 FL=1
MKYEKLICIDTNNDDKLIINNEYKGIKPIKNSAYFAIYDNSNKIIDLYPNYMFKALKQLRK